MENIVNTTESTRLSVIEQDDIRRERTPDLIQFPHGDYGNLLRYYALHEKNELVFDSSSRKFFRFEDGIWREMHRIEVSKTALDAMVIYREQVAELDEEDERKKVHEPYATKATQKAAISALVELLTMDLQVDLTDVVPARHKIPVLNGLYDLAAGRLLEDDRCEFFNHKVGCPYADGFFENSRFRIFLQEITGGNEEMMEYLKRVYGYALTGEVREQTFFILLGSGANGKTTLNEAIAAVVGKFAQHIPIDTLLSGNGGHTATPYLARAKGVRMLFASEGKKAHVLDEAAVKVLTGSNTLATRKLYGEPFEYAPEFTIFLDTNVVPRIENLDHAMKRRLVVIPFSAKFTKKDRDENLLDELMSEEEQIAILEWLTEGAHQYYRNGLGRMPKTVKSATKRCLAENSSVAAFLKKCVKKAAGSKCTAEELYHAYVVFCEEGEEFPVTQTAFGRRMTALGYERGRGAEVFYRGIALK